MCSFPYMTKDLSKDRDLKTLQNLRYRLMIVTKSGPSRCEIEQKNSPSLESKQCSHHLGCQGRWSWCYSPGRRNFQFFFSFFSFFFVFFRFFSFFFVFFR